MSNIPIIAFDSVEHLGNQSETAPLSSGRSDESSFDSFLKDAGQSLEDVHSKKTTEPSEAHETEPPASSEIETDPSDDGVQANGEENTEASGQVDEAEGDEAIPVSDESQDKPDGQTNSDHDHPGNSGENRAENGSANMITGRSLPFPQVIAMGDEEMNMQPMEVVLASQKSGISVLGNENMPSASGHAKGGAPGANALARQTEIQSGVTGQGEGAQNKSGIANLGNAEQNVPEMMPKTSPFGADGMKNSSGKGSPENGPIAGGAQNSDSGGVSPDGELLAASGAVLEEVEAESKDAPLKENAAKENTAKENGAKPDLKNANVEKAAQKNGVGNETQMGFKAEYSSEPTEHVFGPKNDAKILRTQFSQPGDAEGENGALKEGVSSVSGQDSAANIPEPHLTTGGSEQVLPEVKVSPEIQPTVESLRGDSSLRTSVQEQVLEEAVAKVSLAIRDKVSHARIRLDPPSLGRVDMRLQVEDGVLTAKVTVESAWVKDALTSNLKELRDALEEHGVQLEQFSVDIDAGMGSWGSDEMFGGEDSDEALYLGSNPQEEDSADSPEEAEPAVSVAGEDSSNVDLFA